MPIPQGASAGLGFETARTLALVGGHVFVAARSQASAIDTVSRLRTALGAKGAAAQLTPLELNLSSLAAVERSAAAFQAQSSKLDCLINNAGVSARQSWPRDRWPRPLYDSRLQQGRKIRFLRI